MSAGPRASVETATSSRSAAPAKCRVAVSRTWAAVERARSGGGPTLIEGLTYRIESHTNSDDPTRYRQQRDVEHWKRRDPIERLEKYLVSEGALTTTLREEIGEAAEELAARTREAMSVEPELDPLELFDHVYATPRAALAEQRAALEAQLAPHGAAEEVTTR